MQVNLIEWLVDNYNVDKNLLKLELQYSFAKKNLGKYLDKKELSNVTGLRRVDDSIDRLFIWPHAHNRKGLYKKKTISFVNIHKDWKHFCDINNLDITDVYYDFNFFKKEKLKICFEGD